VVFAISSTRSCFVSVVDISATVFFPFGVSIVGTVADLFNSNLSTLSSFFVEVEFVDLVVLVVETLVVLGATFDFEVEVEAAVLTVLFEIGVPSCTFGLFLLPLGLPIGTPAFLFIVFDLDWLEFILRSKKWESSGC
jgi:hypothetical protein